MQTVLDYMRQWTGCFADDLSARLTGAMLFFLWLLVLCCAAGGQEIEDWTNRTNMMDSSWGTETGFDRSERCKLCKDSPIFRHIPATWKHRCFCHVHLSCETCLWALLMFYYQFIKQDLLHFGGLFCLGNQIKERNICSLIPARHCSDIQD
jgi:hypothetical protein